MRGGRLGRVELVFCQDSALGILITEKLHEGRCNCKLDRLIIWGERDEVDPVKTGQLLYEALTCTKALEIVSGNGHAGHLDRHREKVFMLTAAWILQLLGA